MEIYYCAECRTRLSSVDIDQGKGVLHNSKPYCDVCTKKLGLAAAPAPQRKTGSAPKRRGSSIQRVPSAVMNRPAHTRGSAAPAGTSSNAKLIIVAMIIIAGLLGVIALILLKKSPPPAVPSEHTEDRVLPDDPDRVDPVPPPSVPAEIPGLTKFAGLNFAKDNTWHNLVYDGWKRVWNPRGRWSYTDSMLQARLSRGSTAAIETQTDWGNCEWGVTFQTQVAGDLKMHFHQEGSDRGTVTIPSVTPGSLHTLYVRVIGREFQEIRFDDKPIDQIPGASAAPAGMPAKEGRTVVEFRNTSDQNGILAVGEVGLKRVVETHWLEAEYPIELTPPMSIHTGTKSSGRYIKSPNGNGMNRGKATFEVNITQPGRYLMWGRVYADNGQDDSFYIEANGYKAEWWCGAAGRWKWDRVTDEIGGKDPAWFDLKAGRNLVTVHVREDGSSLDKLVITNDLQLRPSREGEPGENLSVQTRILAEDSRPESLAPVPPTREWGPAIVLDPVRRKDKWAIEGSGKLTWEGDVLAIDSTSYDLLYKAETDRFRLEGELQFKNSQSGHDMIIVWFPKRNANRVTAEYKVFFYGDSTLDIFKGQELLYKQMYHWQAADAFRFDITVDGGKLTVSVNGVECVSKPCVPYPYKGGIQISPNKRSASCSFAFRDLKLRLPLQGAAAPAAGGRAIALQQGADGYSGCIDTYTTATRPDEVDRDTDRIELSKDDAGKFAQEIFLRFDLAGLAGIRPESVQSAMLTLWACRQSAIGGFTVYRIDEGDWDESLTWTQAAGFKTTRHISRKLEMLPGRVGNTIDPPHPIQIDVTALVKGWLGNPTSNKGFVLRGDAAANDTDIRFNSSENRLSATRPRLEIKLTE